MSEYLATQYGYQNEGFFKLSRINARNVNRQKRIHSEKNFYSLEKAPITRCIFKFSIKKLRPLSRSVLL